MKDIQNEYSAFGPQGSGKGTQALLLCQKYGLFYFESGAYLRKVAETNPDLKKSLDLGNLVPDKEMTSYLTAFFDEKNYTMIYYLMGFQEL